MAREDLLDNRKFKRLVRVLDQPRPHVLGYLELLWRSAHTNLDPVFLRGDVELECEWPGDEGVLVSALLSCGFMDEQDEAYLVVHDYEENAPDYVWDRLRKRQEREARKRKMRHASTHSPDASTESPECSGLPNRTEPNRTEPNPTQPSRTEPNRTCAREPNEPRRVGVATAIGRLMGSASDIGAFQKDLQDRILGVTGEEGWSEWWEVVLERITEAGGRMDELENAVRYAEDCADPAKRRAKDLGELRSPGGYLVKKAQTVCQAAGVRWPTFPGTVAAR